MKIIPITSENNPLVKKVRGLRLRASREKSGLFLIEGQKLLEEAFAHGLAVKDVLASKSFLQSGLGHMNSAKLTSLHLVDDKLFQSMASTDTSCGVIATAEAPSWTMPHLLKAAVPLIVICLGIQDPGNLGTIVRTALAASASGVIFTKGTVHPFNPKVVRSAAGALFRLPFLIDLTSSEAFELVKKHGMTVIACEPTATNYFWQVDLTRPLALVLGNEGQGFSSADLACAHETVAIPMNEASESLNVAVSAGIILFGAVQQRMARQYV